MRRDSHSRQMPVAPSNGSQQFVARNAGGIRGAMLVRRAILRARGCRPASHSAAQSPKADANNVVSALTVALLARSRQFIESRVGGFAVGNQVSEEVENLGFIQGVERARRHVGG